MNHYNRQKHEFSQSVAARLQKCSIIKFEEQFRKVGNGKSKELFSDPKKLENSESYSLKPSMTQIVHILTSKSLQIP